MVLKDTRDKRDGGTPTSPLDQKKKSLKGGWYRGGYRGKGTRKVERNSSDLNVALAPSGFKGRSNSHRNQNLLQRSLSTAYYYDLRDANEAYWEMYYNDMYGYNNEPDERWDGEHGPYTYAEFYEYYGNADLARDAWSRGEEARDDGEDLHDVYELEEMEAAASLAAASAPPQPPQAVQVCDICCEPTAAGLQKRFTQSCRASAAHSDGFCSNCVQSWIGAALDQDRIAIQCPATGCDARMSRRNVKNSATKEQFALFEELSTRDYSAKYDEIMADPALALWATANTVQCPYCLQLVNRSTGCNHMVCACGEWFCYGCGGKKCTCHDPLAPATLEEQQLLAEVTVEYARELKEQLAVTVADSIRDVMLLEWRVDGTDGFAYPRAAFMEHYGSYQGLRRWMVAGVVQALLANSTVSAASDIYDAAFQQGFQ